ncbi:MAG: VOC family protein [Hyphomicrobiaceae bacterium]
MRTKANPAGTRLVSALRYRRVPAAIDWLCAAFGFEKDQVVSGDDGSVLYANLTCGGHMVMVLPVDDSALGQFFKQPYEVGGVETQTCYIVVDDADAHYRTAKAAGASIVLDISDDDLGGRGYACRDPEGHIWSFGTYDPWQPRAAAQSTGLRPRVVIAAILVGAAILAGSAGWMLPRPPAQADQRRLQHDASAARERLEQATARTSSLAAELSQERSAKDAAERTSREAQEQLARDQGAKSSAEASARQLEEQLAAARRANETSTQKAKEANSQIVGERAAKQAAERAAADIAKELVRARDARQRAERSAQETIEQSTRERRAKDEAERAATQAREQLAQALANRVEADPEEAEPHDQPANRAGTGKIPTGGVAPGSDGMTD